jgi:glycogen synthase
MDWIAGNSLYKSSPYTRQQQQSTIFTIHNIEFHTQREITQAYNSSQKSHISYIQLLISN